MEFLVLLGVGQFLLGVGGILVGVAAIWYVFVRSEKNE